MVRCAATQVTGGMPAADMGAEAKTGGKTDVKADATTSDTADGAEAEEEDDAESEKEDDGGRRFQRRLLEWDCSSDEDEDEEAEPAPATGSKRKAGAISTASTAAEPGV